jgi:streptogramin lyase
LVRIDPATNKVAETIAIGGSPVGIVDAFGSIWVVDQNGDRVVRVDPAVDPSGKQVTGPRRLTSIPLDLHAPGARPRAIAWGITTADGAIWVTDRISQVLLRIDPGLERVVGSIDLSQSTTMCCGEGTPAKLAAGFGRIWITGASLKSYDPVTGVIKSYLTQVNPRVAIGKDSVWVAGSSNYLIQRLDPVTGKVTAQSTFPITPSGDFWSYEANVTETSDGHVWIGTDQGYRLIEVTPTP